MIGRRQFRDFALTLLETLVAVAVICLLIVLLLPSLANRHRRSESTQCFSNLKQISLGALLWGLDRESDFPWHVPLLRTGTLELASSPSVFRHFEIMSNELYSPKILLCPLEERRTTAGSFERLSNANISYFVNVAAHFNTNSSAAALVGDRNVTGGAVSNGFLRSLSSTNDLGWSKELHQHFGIIALSDGAAELFSTQALHELVRTSPAPLRFATP